MKPMRFFILLFISIIFCLVSCKNTNNQNKNTGNNFCDTVIAQDSFIINPADSVQNDTISVINKYPSIVPLSYDSCFLDDPWEPYFDSIDSINTIYHENYQDSIYLNSLFELYNVETVFKILRSYYAKKDANNQNKNIEKNLCDTTSVQDSLLINPAKSIQNDTIYKIPPKMD